MNSGRSKLILIFFPVQVREEGLMQEYRLRIKQCLRAGLYVYTQAAITQTVSLVWDKGQ